MLKNPDLVKQPSAGNTVREENFRM